MRKKEINDKYIGRILQIFGAVIDVEFSQTYLPSLYEALEVKSSLTKTKILILEVSSHLGENKVRCIALGPSDGLKRGDQVIATKQPITVPVGKKTLGRLFNVVGDPIDDKGEVKTTTYYPIHRNAPKLREQSTKLEILETGIKVIDLIAPFVKGGKVAIFGGAGVGKTVLIQELIHNVA